MTMYQVSSVYKKQTIVREGPFTKEEAERTKWYLETVQRHKNVTIIAISKEG